VALRRRLSRQSNPDDDKFTACAVALGAEYVISGDKALLAVGGYIGVRIVGPTQFLDGWQEPGPA